jgi:hypothetical protein|tara:strand:+ start:962 stop:1174 length:213 start_codon:yes stop_codon:yes gene_type:complete
MDKQNNTVKLGEVFSAVETILEAARSEGGKRAVIGMLSDNFNPEMFSLIGEVNDNYSDTLERMREAFGVK